MARPDLVCPRCLETNCVRLDLADGDTLTCYECDNEYTVNDIIALVDGWAPYLAWIKSHPANQPQE